MIITSLLVPAWPARLAMVTTWPFFCSSMSGRKACNIDDDDDEDDALDDDEEEEDDALDDDDDDECNVRRSFPAHNPNNQSSYKCLKNHQRITSFAIVPDSFDVGHLDCPEVCKHVHLKVPHNPES